MCLNSLCPMPEELPKFGYKVFRIHADGTFNGLYDHTVHEHFKEGIWYEAGDCGMLITLEEEDAYEIGFHCYTNLKDAERKLKRYLFFYPGISSECVVIKKVEVDKILAWGVEISETVFVTNRIKICV